MLTPILVAFHVVFSLAMVGFILMHRGTGGGLSDMFGGGGGQLQGSAIVEKNLDRLTIITALGWMATTVLLGLRL